MEEESESSCFYLFIFRLELFMKVEINQLTKQYDNKTVLNIEQLDIEKPGILTNNSLILLPKMISGNHL